jgi:hypothetical protein
MNVEGKILVPIEYDQLVLEEAKFGFKAKKDGKDEFVVLK